MAVLLIVFVVMLSVAVFFFMAVKFGSAKDKVADVLDLDSIPRPQEKEAEPLLLDDEDEYV